jgi:hypothetical protein
MRTPNLTRIFALAFAGLALAGSATSAVAQTSAKVNSLKSLVTGSPQFTITGAKKKFKPKSWLIAEAEMTFSAKVTPKDGYLTDSVDVSFYLLLKGAKKKSIVKHEETFQDVPVNEKVAVAAYLSPAKFARLVGKARPTLGDVEAIAIEVRAGGKLIAGDQKGFKVKGKSRPWEAVSPEAEMLPKSKTPFAVLFYDLYLESASE